MTFFLNVKCIANCAKNEINHFVAWYELSNIEKVSCAFLKYKVVFPLGQYKSGTSYSKHVHDHTFLSQKLCFYKKRNKNLVFVVAKNAKGKIAILGLYLTLGLIHFKYILRHIIFRRIDNILKLNYLSLTFRYNRYYPLLTYLRTVKT